MSANYTSNIAQVAARTIQPNFLVCGMKDGKAATWDAVTALSAKNTAKQARNQLGYTDVVVYRRNKDGEYGVDAKLSENSSAEATAAEVAQKRLAVAGLRNHNEYSHTMSVRKDFSDEARMELVRSFMTAYEAIGGTIEELTGNIDAIESDSLAAKR